ncbi:MAG: RNA methyltransferase [Elusimicrobia bacterium]|nr:RNA methyltransferase [Elusimicrobiota bacterium]
MRAVRARFVLVRPSNALNIGAAARAMANFGLEDLVAVEPYAKGWRAARSALYGSELLRRAPVLSLARATADCHVVLGTDSGAGRALRRPVVTLPALRGWLARRLPRGGKVAVLFGCERSGLDNESLDRCHALLRIPTSPSAPSMNLGQAVAVAAYELLKARLERSVAEPAGAQVDGLQLEGLVESAMRAMERAGVNGHKSERDRRRRFRRGLLQWRMTRADASWLRGLLDRLAERARP